MIARHISSRLLAALADSPVVLLHGARQTGKSTLVQHVTSNDWLARYLTLDDLSVLSAATADPTGFLAGMEGPIALDEIQRASELFLAIKADVDRNRRPGRFLLTGSANVLMLPKLSESLAGRMEILRLWPLSQGEIAGHREGFVDLLFRGDLGKFHPDAARGNSDMAERILRGGYPEAHSRAAWSRRRAWFNSYVMTILQRDVRDLSHIEGLGAMPRLLSLLASRASTLLNNAELSRSLGLPQSTLKRYMALLETTFLVQLLPAWSGNLIHRFASPTRLAKRCLPQGLRPSGAPRRSDLSRLSAATPWRAFRGPPTPPRRTAFQKPTRTSEMLYLGKRLVKSPKVHLSDTGLAAAILGLGDEKALRDSHLFGPLLENFVVAELFKQVTWSKTEPALFHFRTLTAQEVDVVMESPSGELVGIEIKAGASVNAADFKWLRVLAEETGKRFRCGVVLYQGRETVPFGKNLHALPIEALWQA